MIPAQEWWSIIEAYGGRIWPAQIVFYIVALLLMAWFLFKPGRIQSTFIKLYLAIAFAWNGIVFFLILAKDITGESYGNYCFGSLFIIVSILFAVDLFRQKMQFSLPTSGWRTYATVVLLVLVFCSPLFSIALGRSSASLVMPGTIPCPTTALGLLVLTTALPRVDKIAYILLLLWAIPCPPLTNLPKYGVYEDTIMFFCGVYSLIVLVRYWKVEGTGD